MDNQVGVEMIMDQKDIVDERQQNIKDISVMMKRANDISEQMNNLIKESDQNLDTIIKTQDEVYVNAENTTNDMLETNEINKKKLKKVFIWVVALILLGICIIGLVYIIKGTKKKGSK